MTHWRNPRIPRLVGFVFLPACVAACVSDRAVSVKRPSGSGDDAGLGPDESNDAGGRPGSGGASNSGGNGDGSTGGRLNGAGGGSDGGTTNPGGASAGGATNPGGTMNQGGASAGGTVNQGGTSAGGTVSTGGASAGGRVSSGGASAGGRASGGATNTGGSGGAATACLMGNSGDYTKPGPYTVTTQNVDLASMLPTGATSPTTYTIYYPASMEAGCPHPIIAWGNGTSATSSVYAFLSNNAASWGMVVISSDNGNVNGYPYLQTGIDYLLAQNQASSSVFYKKLGTRAGTAGHSQGAIAATSATQHANVVAEVQVEGAGTPKQGIAFLALAGTADTTIPVSTPTQSYNNATGPSMLAVYTGADHTTTPTVAGYTQQNPGTIQFLRLYTAWFRCFLADDAKACALFKGGQSCGICSDPNWDTLTSKNL